MIILDKDKKTYNISPVKSSGEECMRCPKCNDERKKKNLKPFSWNHTKSVGYCNHCETSFYVEKEKESEYFNKTFVKPILKSNTIQDKVVDWFKTRGISKETLLEANVTTGMEWMPQKEKEVNTIQFNYYQDGELINVKYRTSEKEFKLCKDAKLIPYNIDSIKDQKEFYIVEGEMDALTLIEIGIKNVISVPNGAGKNLTWLDDCIFNFENKIAIIAVDNDIKGLELQSELIRRLQPENCRLVEWVDCKDANESLLKFGIEKTKYKLLNYSIVKISGIFDVLDFEKQLDHLWWEGLKPGMNIGYSNFDDLCTFETGRLLIVTGIPGHGKSEFIDEITSRLNLLHKLKCGFFSPENQPLEIHASKLIRKFTGKKFHSESLGEADYKQAKRYLHNNFYFIVPEENFDIHNILDKVRYLIKTKGIKIAVIDPWNRIDHQQENGENETRYISRILDIITNFARKNNILIILAAHPVKMKKENGKYEVPNLYSISGSAHFFAKTDYGITVYRNEDVVEVHVQKVKFEHMGHSGLALFKRNINNGRYEPINEIIDTPEWRNYTYFE